MTSVRGGALPGHEIAGVIFTNASTHKCTLRGFPFAQLRHAGANLGSPATHNPGAVRTITLKPRTGRAQLQLTAISTCQAPISDHVRIRVPRSATFTDVPIELRGCALRVNPIAPG